MRRTRSTTVTAIAAALLTLAACGGGGDDSGTPSTNGGDEPAATDNSDAEDLETAVRTYTDAFFATDSDTAWPMLSARCQSQTTEPAFGVMLEEITGMYGEHAVETFQVDDLSGDLARVTYTIGLPVVDADLAGQPWVREDGTWRYDAC